MWSGDVLSQLSRSKCMHIFSIVLHPSFSFIDLCLFGFVSLVDTYLDLICKSAIIQGSSSNLELGLHLLYYLKGDTKRALKAFLDDTIDLPMKHPINTYTYAGIIIEKKTFYIFLQHNQ